MTSAPDRFNLNDYTYVKVSTHATKRKAQEVAKKWRRAGYNARVIDYHIGKFRWAVFKTTRKRRRRRKK